MIILFFLFYGSLLEVFYFFGVGRFGVCFKFCIFVVVVVCLCVLGLSIFIVVMVGIGVGVKNGIFIKGGKVFEVCKGVKRVVLDKIGMVIEGRMVVVLVVWVFLFSGVNIG